MNGKQSKAAKDKCQEPSTFVSGGSTTKARAVLTMKAALKKHLHAKYSISSRIHFLRPIDSILTAARDTPYIEHKFLQDFDESKEYLRRFYRRKETKEKVAQLCEYFKFHYEIPRLFMDTFIQTIDSFHDRRRHKIYQQVKRLIGKENIVGDESTDQKTEEAAKQHYYSMVLKGLKPSQRMAERAVPSPASDTLQRIVGQLESARDNRSFDDLSITITDHFKENQHAFASFLNRADGKDQVFRPTVAPTHSKVISRKSQTSGLDLESAGIKDMHLHKQKKPTIVKVNTSAMKEATGLKTIIGKALVEPKRSPRENLISNSRAAKPMQSHGQTSKLASMELSSLQKKSMITINNFRKEIEDFHLANSLSGRNRPAFKTFVDKAVPLASGPKSISPRLNVLASSRTGIDSVKLLAAEPSPKLKAKFLMSLSKETGLSQSSSLKQKLVAAKSTGNLNERSAEKSAGRRNKAASKDKHRSSSNQWSTSSRASLANFPASPRDFILVKRLKTEDNGEKAFDRKLSSLSRINVLGKKTSLGGHPSITSTAMDLKLNLGQQASGSKPPPAKQTTSKPFSSFRSRSKMSSMNIN